LSGPRRRTKSTSAHEKRILVFVEGDTEDIYVKYWHRLHRQRVIVVVDDKYGGPMTCVKNAVARREFEVSETKKGRGSGYDEYWCFFDVDEHPNLVDALNLAVAHGIRVALSNPCLELWFVLHSQDQTAYVHRADIQKQSTSLFGFGKKPSQDDLDSLKPSYLAANARAQALDVWHEGNGSPAQSNPSTSVWELVETIAR
jgi:RloB-like protein